MCHPKTVRMKILVFPATTFFSILLLFNSCNTKKEPNNREAFRNEIINTERDFEKAARDKGIKEAFYSFADENAVIKRGNDSLITGKENIKNFYSKPVFREAEVTWKPDFTDVSADGTLGYTYGKYIWKSKDKNGRRTEFRGVFHTVWKRQADGTWRYVWD